jgi:hypothetical protein
VGIPGPGQGAKRKELMLTHSFWESSRRLQHSLITLWRDKLRRSAQGHASANAEQKPTTNWGSTLAYGERAIYTLCQTTLWLTGRAPGTARHALEFIERHYHELVREATANWVLIDGYICN